MVYVRAFWKQPALESLWEEKQGKSITAGPESGPFPEKRAGTKSRKPWTRHGFHYRGGPTLDRVRDADSPRNTHEGRLFILEYLWLGW